MGDLTGVLKLAPFICVDDLKHSLLQELALITDDLGHVPSRDEFALKSNKFTKATIAQAFGNYREFLKAAGYDNHLELARQRANKLKEAFVGHPQERIEEHEPVNLPPKTKRRRILVLGDTHFPWVHKESLERVYAWLGKNQVDVIVQIGDLLDLYAYSRFARSQLGMDAKEEIDLGNSMAIDMWKKLRSLAPTAECYQLLGNHCVRPHRKVLAQAPELEHLVALGMRNYYQFEGVTTMDGDRQELLIDDVLFVHGWGSRPGQHRDHFMHNTVLGHTHKLNTSYRTVYDPVTKEERTLVEANAGLLGDPRAKVFGYTPSRITNYTLGFLVIDDDGFKCINF